MPPVLELIERSGQASSVRHIPLTKAKAGGVAEFLAPPAGFYELRQPGGGADPVALAVHENRDELLSPDPDLAVLRDLAEATGGSFLADGPEATLDGLPRLDATPLVRKTKAGVYWLDEPMILGVILLLLCLEWGMRRRRNLV